MNKERRKEYRINLMNESCGWSYNNVKSKTTSRLVNISSDSAFIESNIFPKSKDILEIVFLLPGDLGNLEVKGVVVWKRWARLKKSEMPLGFAVKLIHTEDSLKIMQAFVTYLCNKQIIKVSKAIMDEFFDGGGKGPRFL